MGRKLDLVEVIDVVSSSLVGGVVDKDGKLTSEEIEKLETLKAEIETYIEIGISFGNFEVIKDAVERERNK